MLTYWLYTLMQFIIHVMSLWLIQAQNSGELLPLLKLYLSDWSIIWSHHQLGVHYRPHIFGSLIKSVYLSAIHIAFIIVGISLLRLDLKNADPESLVSQDWHTVWHTVTWRMQVSWAYAKLLFPVRRLCRQFLFRNQLNFIRFSQGG